MTFRQIGFGLVAVVGFLYVVGVAVADSVSRASFSGLIPW